jgi:hypothetical protein
MSLASSAIFQRQCALCPVVESAKRKKNSVVTKNIQIPMTPLQNHNDNTIDPNMQASITSFETPSISDTSNPQRSKHATCTWTHSPVVLAMLTGSVMRDCDSVRAIHAECLATQSDDNICKTAAAYFAMCMSKNRHD